MTNNSLPPDYFRHSSNFLGLVTSVIKQMIETGNMSDGIIPLEPKETVQERHEEAEQWSDHNVAIPTLFNFYHGIELALKGMLDGINKLDKGHDINALLNQLKSNSYLDSGLEKLITKYTGTSNQFKTLFDDNELNGNQFHQIFKYPETISKKQFNYNSITQQETSLVMFKELLYDIKIFQELKDSWWEANWPQISK
jgi:hypothetical protein